jgi:transcriptional regulator with XRE-family HTH domain
LSNKNGKLTKSKSRHFSLVPKVMKMPITLAEFLNQDMESRKIETEREYARFIGCAPSTVGEYLKGKEPTLDFLRKLSEATKVSLRDLLIIAYPEITMPDDIDPQWKLLYARFKTLPETVQDFILRAMSVMEGASNDNQ